MVDGGYVFAGETRSNDGEQSSNQGSSDVWIVKLAMKENETNTSNGSESAGRPRALIRERSFAGQTIATFKDDGFGLLKEVDPATGELDFRAPLRSDLKDVRLKIPLLRYKRKSLLEQRIF